MTAELTLFALLLLLVGGLLCLARVAELRAELQRARESSRRWLASCTGLRREADALRERAAGQAQERDKTSCRHPMPLVDENLIAGTYDCRACGARFPLAAGCPCESCAAERALPVITYGPPRVIMTCEEAPPRPHELRSLPAGELAQAIHKALRASPGLWASLLGGEPFDRDDRGSHAS